MTGTVVVIANISLPGVDMVKSWVVNLGAQVSDCFSQAALLTLLSCEDGKAILTDWK